MADAKGGRRGTAVAVASTGTHAPEVGASPASTSPLSQIASEDDLDTLQALVASSHHNGSNTNTGELPELPSDLAVQAVKNKKAAIKRGHINAAWSSPPDLNFWLKDLHRWFKAKMESLCAVAGERIRLPEPAPRSGEIPAVPLTESAELSRLREDTRRYLRARLRQLQEEERDRLLSPEDLLVRLYQAAGENDVEEMAWCVARGAAVNDVPPECSDTALHYAAYWGKLHAVQYLVGLGHADLFKKDEAGDTALEVARHFGHAKVCQLLCKAMGLRPSKEDQRQARKKYPGPWHAGELIEPGGKNKFKGVTINLTDARRESLRRYWEALEAKRPQGIRGSPTTLEQLQLTAFAERVKDWFTKLEEGERAFVHQLKMKGVAKWPKNFVRLDLI